MGAKVNYFWISALELMVLGLFPLACGSNTPSSPNNSTPTHTPTVTLTATSTPTNEGGFTSTATDSPTPTFSATLTLTMTATPSPTSTSTMTFTVTSTPTSSILWFSAVAETGLARVDLQVAGVAPTDAGVTLFGPGLSSAMTYLFTSDEAGAGMGDFARYQGPGITSYQVGSTYSLQTVTSAGTASVSFIAPGGSFSVSSDGVTCIWPHPGNADRIKVLMGTLPYFDTLDDGPVTSPYLLPASAYSGGPGDYVVQLAAQNTAFPSNAVVSSGGFEPEVLYSASVTIHYLTSPPTATFTPSVHSFLTQWGGLGTGNGQLNQPDGVAVIGGNVYVLDTFNHRVQKFDTSGNFMLKWGKNGGDGTTGLGNGELYYPEAMVGDGVGNIYVADTYNHRIQKFFDTGSAVTWVATWGKNGGDGTAGTNLGEYNYPSGIALDSVDGYLYVADFGNNRVQQLTTAGVAVTQFGVAGTGTGQFNGPTGIVFEASTGYLYVADYYNNRVQGFRTNPGYLGTVYTIFGTSSPNAGNADGDFDDPYGLTIDSSNHIYIADSQNNRVEEFYEGGPVSFVGKWGKNGGDGSSGSNPYEFNVPLGTALDTSGNVYVADQKNNRIQKFGP